MYMVWGQVCGAAIRCLQTQVVNSIIRYTRRGRRGCCSTASRITRAQSMLQQWGGMAVGTRGAPPPFSHAGFSSVRHAERERAKPGTFFFNSETSRKEEPSPSCREPDQNSSSYPSPAKQPLRLLREFATEPY